MRGSSNSSSGTSSRRNKCSKGTSSSNRKWSSVSSRLHTRMKRGRRTKDHKSTETIRSSRKVTLCWRFALAEGAAGGSVTAFRGRRATGGLSLVAGRPRLRQRLLGRRPDGATLIAAAKWFRRSCRAENGGKQQRSESALAETSFLVLAPRATRIPSVRGPGRTRPNRSDAENEFRRLVDLVLLDLRHSIGPRVVCVLIDSVRSMTCFKLRVDRPVVKGQGNDHSMRR
jgi:hypothetical protein